MGDDTKCKILILHAKKKGSSSISKKVQRPRKTVENFLNRYDQSETLKNNHGGGRRKALDARDIRRLCRLALANRRLSAAKLGELAGLKNVSPRTIQRALKENRILSRKPLKKPKLTKAQREARLNRALEHRT